MTISGNRMPLATLVALKDVTLMLNREMHVPLYVQLKEELFSKIKEEANLYFIFIAKINNIDEYLEDQIGIIQIAKPLSIQYIDCDLYSYVINYHFF